jgi:hypothetical protein
MDTLINALHILDALCMNGNRNTLSKTAETIRIKINNPPDGDKRLLFIVPEMIRGLILKTFLWKYQGCCKRYISRSYAPRGNAIHDAPRRFFYRSVHTSINPFFPA